jgi:hypothetical protein
MKINWRGIGLGVLLTLGLGFLGYLIGSYANQLITVDTFVRWKQLGKPPSGAASFIAIGRDFKTDRVWVSVKNARGEAYLYSGEKDGQWEPGEGFAGQIPQDCAGAIYPPSDPSFQQLPGKPRKCASIVWSWEWDTISDLFVILADGSVWQWQVRHTFAASMAWICVTPLALIAAGWIVLLAIRLVRRKNSVKNPTVD